MTATLVSKGEFAAIINVSPGRVSQFIASGQISREAIVGSGQRAKINVDRARSDLRLTLDVSQRLGNGIDTRLDEGPAVLSNMTDGANLPDRSGQEPTRANIDLVIKQQKLEALLRANRNAAVADEKERGRFTETSASTKAMGQVATSMLDIFEGGLSDMAGAVAAAFKLPERDVKHILRQEYRKVRENGVRQMRLKAIELPEFVESEIIADDAEVDDP